MKKSNKILWFAGSIILIALIVGVFNIKIPFYHVVGSGRLMSESRIISDFDSVAVNGRFNITIRQTGLSTVRVITDSNIIPYIESEIVDNYLELTTRHFGALSPSNKIQVDMTTKALDQISIGGNNQVDILDMDNDELTINLGGENTAFVHGTIGHLSLNLGGNNNFDAYIEQADIIELNIGGNATINLSGNVEHLIVNAGGTVTLIADELVAERVSITGAGLYSMIVTVNESLNVEALGKGEIHYYGNPVKVNNASFGDVELKKIIKVGE